MDQSCAAIALIRVKTARQPAPQNGAVKRSHFARIPCSRAVFAGATGALAILAHASIAHAGTVAGPPPSLSRYRCYICHSDRETLVGPAFADIAAFSKATAEEIKRP